MDIAQNPTEQVVAKLNNFNTSQFNPYLEIASMQPLIHNENLYPAFEKNAAPYLAFRKNEDPANLVSGTICVIRASRQANIFWSRRL
jgi:hypothetical protein